MAILKAKQIREMKKEDKDKKMKELKVELIKANAKTGQGNSNVKEIKKAIARLLTIN
ncbi:MAG: 50S ribosomal protein L29 [Nanoarchaeota archaeon]|jgi:ribosomal protein L29|nr:50S ribosomal protein L29 [Nanoarchaeota archaeon]